MTSNLQAWTEFSNPLIFVGVQKKHLIGNLRWGDLLHYEAWIILVPRELAKFQFASSYEVFLPLSQYQ